MARARAITAAGIQTTVPARAIARACTMAYIREHRAILLLLYARARAIYSYGGA